jgi:hypothetical protein
VLGILQLKDYENVRFEYCMGIPTERCVITREELGGEAIRKHVQHEFTSKSQLPNYRLPLTHVTASLFSSSGSIVHCAGQLELFLFPLFVGACGLKTTD